MHDSCHHFIPIPNSAIDGSATLPVIVGASVKVVAILRLFCSWTHVDPSEKQNAEQFKLVPRLVIGVIGNCFRGLFCHLCCIDTNEKD